MSQVGKNAFNKMMSDRQDVPLHDSVKHHIQEFIDTLQKEYDLIIDSPTCKENDALEYILLFNIFGLLTADMLNVTMEEYYMATDVMVQLLGIEARYDEE